MKLSGQEFRTLQYIARGFKDHEIAELTMRSKRTIESHRMNMIKKLGAKNCAHAVSVAYKKGIL